MSSDAPNYPSWVRSSRVRQFWLLSAIVIAIGAASALVWLPLLAIALLALPFLYVAVVITIAGHQLGQSGGDLQRKIHGLIAKEAGSSGRLLDIGCGSGQLVIRLAKESGGECTGLDYWGDDWEYSRTQAERNAAAEGVGGIRFVHGSASQLPFGDGEFTRVVSCMTFHEVSDVADKTRSVVEALRVLAPGGSFAFVDLFDDAEFYPGRQSVLDVIAAAGATVETTVVLTDHFRLGFPMNLRRVLGHAVMLAGAKRV